jgi:putative component of toxin-antitoxin plasmid stabilization module
MINGEAELPIKRQAQRGQMLLLLLIGGDKSTQQKNIETAMRLARNFKE